jgi:hypothetical protein
MDGIARPHFPAELADDIDHRQEGVLSVLLSAAFQYPVTT